MPHSSKTSDAEPIAAGGLTPNPEDGHLYIAIQEADGGFSGHIHAGDETRGYRLPDLDLAKTAQPIEGRDWTLGNVVDAIRLYQKKYLDALDERAQLDIGRHLYRQTLGRLPDGDQTRLREHKTLSVKIQTESEWIARLPWNLLAEWGIFFTAEGWSVSICRKPDDSKHKLPPSPRLLLIAPEPPKWNNTLGKKHLADLTKMLSQRDKLFTPGKNLAIVATWEEFVETVPNFRPELIYYYGHGTGDARITRLIFESGPKRKADPRPITDFARALSGLDQPPLLAYINCCLGDAGGFLGAGMQLGDKIPAVITNRTLAEVPVARTQAMTVWENILFNGEAPHEAVSRLYAQIDLTQQTTADPRWTNPVLHAHYGRWISNAPSVVGRFSRDPHWHLKIDRVRQYNDVVAQTRLMKREQKPKSLVFVWYGEEGQGVEKFHQRLRVELPEEIDDFVLHEVRPRWPEHLEYFHDAFSDVFTEAFRVRSLEDIPGRLRKESLGRPTVLYVNHQPVPPPGKTDPLIHPETLKLYVKWWNDQIAAHLEKKQFALLTVSFLVSNPPAFRECVRDKKIVGLPLSHTVFWLLDQMEKIAEEDLHRFLQTHNIELPEGRKDDVLQEILRKTGGKYDLSVEALKNIYREAYRLPSKTESPKKKKFNY
jgi:hypothetical protein